MPSQENRTRDQSQSSWHRLQPKISVGPRTLLWVGVMKIAKSMSTCGGLMEMGMRQGFTQKMGRGGGGGGILFGGGGGGGGGRGGSHQQIWINHFSSTSFDSKIRPINIIISLPLTHLTRKLTVYPFGGKLSRTPARFRGSGRVRINPDIKLTARIRVEKVQIKQSFHAAP